MAANWHDGQGVCAAARSRCIARSAWKLAFVLLLGFRHRRPLTPVSTDLSFASSYSACSATLRPGCLNRKLLRLELAANQFDRERLEKESSWTGDVYKQFMNMFKPKEPELTQDQVAAAARREESAQSTQQTLQGLKLSVTAGQDEQDEPIRRTAPIGMLQSKAKQSLVILAVTDESQITDVLLSMRIEAKEFAGRNVLVVPALISVVSRQLVPLSPNLKNAKLMKQGGVALPVVDSVQDSSDWGELLATEIDEADKQGMGDEIRKVGLTLVVTRRGDVIRRGLGRPNWKVVFADIDE